MKLGNFKSSNARSGVNPAERHLCIVLSDSLNSQHIFFMTAIVKAFLGGLSCVLLRKLQPNEKMSEQHP